MTDFLTNLVARTIAQPTLRPRTRARFEPVPDDSPLPLDGERVPEGRVRGREIAAPGEPEVVTEVREVPTTNTVIVPRERTVTITKEKRVVIPQERTKVIREREEAPAPPAPPHRLQIEAQAGSTRVVERVSPPPEPAAETPPVQPALRASGNAGVPAGWPAGVPPAPPVTARVRPGSPTRVPSPPSFTGGGTLPGQPAGRRRSAVASEPSQPQEQTIHVSIGRVEVRAVAPAAAAPKAPAQKPMTIDDYVARREKKERR